VLTVLSIYGILYSFSLLFANVLVATGRTLRLLLIQLAWVAVLVPSIVLGLRLSGLTGVAWAHVITIGLIAVPAYAYAVLRATRQRLAPLLLATVRPLVAALVGGSAAWAIAQLITVGWLSLVVGGMVGVGLYGLVVLPDVMRRLPPRMRPSWVPLRWREPRTVVEESQ
jgi:PST family polysaccharide transporter